MKCDCGERIDVSTSQGSAQIKKGLLLSQTIVLKIIRLYQLTLSPYIGRQCRFYPTCSHYAMEAVQIHGAWVGSLIAFKRLVRCHPFNEGGVDMVPERITPSRPS